MLNIAILGCTGRMGQALLSAISEHSDLQISAATVKANSPFLNQDVGVLLCKPSTGVMMASHLNQASNTDVIIDFTTPEAMLNHLNYAIEFKKPMVVGVTGLSDEQKNQLQQASKQIPIMFSPNMSVGVNACFQLIQQAAKLLGETADIEIIEAHHRNKVDAPSGTALKMGEIIAQTLGLDLSKDALYGRQGIMEPRNPKTIGFSTIRAGDIAGEHTVLFALEGEQIEITHKATSRATFAQGALRAARWLHNKAPGLYNMQDVLYSQSE